MQLLDKGKYEKQCGSRLEKTSTSGLRSTQSTSTMPSLCCTALWMSAALQLHAPSCQQAPRRAQLTVETASVVFLTPDCVIGGWNAKVLS